MKSAKTSAMGIERICSMQFTAPSAATTRCCRDAVLITAAVTDAERMYVATVPTTTAIITSTTVNPRSPLSPLVLLNIRVSKRRSNAPKQGVFVAGDPAP